MSTINKFNKYIKKGFRAVGYKIERLPVGSPKQRYRSVEWLKHFQYLEEMFRIVEKVPGDIVECGVGAGRSFYMLVYLAMTENSGSERMVWGFDSFKGFPEPSKEDHSLRNPQKGDWDEVSVEKVVAYLKLGDIPDNFLHTKVKLVPGYFSDSLQTFPEREIAFLHIDGDLYQSYKDALRILFPKVSKGGIVLFDEYKKLTKWPGATIAVDEFLKEHNYEISHHSKNNKYYIVK